MNELRGADDAMPETDPDPDPESGFEPEVGRDADLDGVDEGANGPDPAAAPASDAAAQAFLVSPSAYVHDEWFDAMEHGALLRTLRATARTEPHLSRVLLGHFGLTVDDDSRVALEEPRVRTLCLAGPEALHRLVRHLGLIAGSISLRRVVDGPTVRRVRELIGERDYRFALERAESLVPEARLAALPEPNLEELPGSIDRQGLRLLAALLRALPEGVRRRLSLKLPVAWAAACESPFDLDEDWDALALIDLLMREGEPS